MTDKLDPAQFSLQNIMSRIDKVGDLWKPVPGKGLDIAAALSKIDKT